MTDQKDVLAQGASDGEFQTLMIAEAHERYPQSNGHSRPAFIAGAKWAREFASLTPAGSDIVDRLEADTRSAAHCAMSEEAAVEIKRLRALVADLQRRLECQ